MEGTMTAVEVTGTVNENRQLLLDGPLPVSGPARVRVIILYPLTGDIDETEWLRSVAHSPAFDFLHDPQEDIYSLADGQPFHDEV
ncbi:MAG: hypothetical protein AB1791_03500 [Chloroflexota bacterium]